MKGKEKCAILKDIRQRIAQENDIELVTKNCEHKGDCKGTCPRCEAEVRYLEQELEKKRKLGKSIAITALSAAMLFSAAGCVDQARDANDGNDGSEIEYLAGEAPETYEYIDGQVEAQPSEDVVELEGDVVYAPQGEDDETAGEPTECIGDDCEQ